MARRRKRSGSSTAPISVAPSDQRETVSITKIKNGYLVEKSGVKRGKYFSEKEFSPTKPVVSAMVPKGAPVSAARRSPARRPRPVPIREVGFLNRSR